jgi:hypothetical protein
MRPAAPGVKGTSKRELLSARHHLVVKSNMGGGVQVLILAMRAASAAVPGAGRQLVGRWCGAVTMNASGSP